MIEKEWYDSDDLDMYEFRMNLVDTGQYKSLPDNFMLCYGKSSAHHKYYGGEPMSEEEAMIDSVSMLSDELELRVTILNKVADVYKKKHIENLSEFERICFIRKNISSTRAIPFWRTSYYIKYHDYPYYLLGVKRLQKSRAELKYMKQWDIRYMPPWITVGQSKPPWKDVKHSSGMVRKYLGANGVYSSYNRNVLGAHEKYHKIII